MKLNSNYFLVLFVFLVNWKTISCRGEHGNSANFETLQKSDSLYQDTIKYPKVYYLPSLQNLTLKSPILKDEAFATQDDEISFIVGDILILSVDEKLIYLELLPKTSEDNFYYIQLISQNLNDNKFDLIKKWEGINTNGEQIKLSDFFKSNFEEISTFLKSENLSFLTQKLDFKDSVKFQNNVLTEKFEEYKNELNDLSIINQIEIKSNSSQPVILNKVLQNQICPNCGNILIYKSDILGEIISDDKKTNLLIIGILEHINHSPSALQIRFINLKENL